MATLADRAHRLPRVIYLVRHRFRCRHRLRLSGVVRGLFRPRRFLRRHGLARITVKLPRGRRIFAAAGRILSAVLRFGRHAVRSTSLDPPAASALRRHIDYYARQISGCFFSGLVISLSPQHGAYRIGEPGSDRRVFFHLGRTGSFSGPHAPGRPKPGSRRFDHFDRFKPSGLPRHRACASMDSIALETRPSFRAAR